MSINGFIVNNFGTTLNVDLYGQRVDPGTPLIGFTLNQPGTRNQNVRHLLL
jgi:hypothetical protein